jgi:hypothetical protein
VKDDEKQPVRTIDVFFGGSFLPEDKAYCQNPDALLEQYYLPQMLHLVVLRESISYRYVMDRQKAATPTTASSVLGTEPKEALRKQILLSGDLSYSFQPSVAAMEYWTEYYVTRGYYGHRFFAAATTTTTTSTTTTSSKHLASPTKPLILLFSRVNNFARGVRILRNDNESTQERQRPIGGNQDPRRSRNRHRQRRSDDHDEMENHDPYGDGEPPNSRHLCERDEQRQQQQHDAEIDQQPSTTSKLMVKVANGTKVLLNTSHVVFTSSSDIEDASHFQFLRVQYPYLFPRPRRPTGRQAPSLDDEVHRNRDALVLCQSVEQLFALVSLADHTIRVSWHIALEFPLQSFPIHKNKSS